MLEGNVAKKFWMCHFTLWNMLILCNFTLIINSICFNLIKEQNQKNFLVKIRKYIHGDNLSKLQTLNMYTKFYLKHGRHSGSKQVSLGSLMRETQDLYGEDMFGCWSLPSLLFWRLLAFKLLLRIMLAIPSQHLLPLNIITR